MRGAWTVTLGGRSTASRPVSAEAVADFFDAAAADAGSAERALAALLRRAFPRAWWQRRGVADRLLDLPPKARAAVVTQLLRPPKPREAEKAPDPWDALAAQNTAPDAPASSATLTVRHALAQCERFYGPAFVWNPARWGTDDGGVPYPVLWEAWHRMQAIHALERLSATSAAARAQGGDAAQAAVEADARRAYHATDPAPVTVDASAALGSAVVLEVDGRRVVARPLSAAALRRFAERRASRWPVLRRRACGPLFAAAFPRDVARALATESLARQWAVAERLLAHYAGAGAASPAGVARG